MSQGVLYHFNPDVDSDDPQLVIPQSMRREVLKELHDSPTAGHNGVERTYQRVSKSYYFPGMKRYITEYIKDCNECQRYKPSNLKPAGLLQTPVPAQRFEVLAMDLFGPLPAGANDERWVFLVEDTATKWVELFPLPVATAEACAKTLVEEVFLRYGFPRRVISDNGVQFVSQVMQKAMHTLGVEQNLIPLYHPEANPAERKNRDLKSQLAILVEGNHTNWPSALPAIRFAMNSAVTQSTGKSPAYLAFGREMRSPVETRHDLRAVIQAENFVPQITPYLLKLSDDLVEAREYSLQQQDHRKAYADQKRRPHEEYNIGDKVLLKTHILSNQAKGITSKFAPRRDGPYTITKIVSPTTYILSNKDEVIGKYHASDLTRYHQRSDDVPAEPVMPQRKRGRPPKRTPAAPTPPAATNERKKRGRPRKKEPVCRPMGEDDPMARRGSL